MDEENLNEKDQNSPSDAAASEGAAPETPAVPLEVPEDAGADQETETLTAPADAVPAPQDISGSIAAVFVLSMIFGLGIFGQLSRRWKT